MVDEAIATDGDLRRICDLFGVTIATAQHYTNILSHPALTQDDKPSVSAKEPTPRPQTEYP